MQKQNYAYVRVSSKEQKENRQLVAIRAIEIPEKNIFMDKLSGKDFQRPNYLKMLKRLRREDVLYIKSIDRLGRNYREILERFGRPRRALPENFDEARSAWRDRTMTLHQAAQSCGLPNSTFYRAVVRAEDEEK